MQTVFIIIRIQQLSAETIGILQTQTQENCFKNTNMQECDFTETDLSGAIFDNCDLLKATFDRTNLEKADFRTAFNYSLDPENNRIKKARFSTASLHGLLQKYDIAID